MGLESHRTERSGAGEEKGDVVIEDRHHECKMINIRREEKWGE